MIFGITDGGGRVWPRPFRLGVSRRVVSGERGCLPLGAFGRSRRGILGFRSNDEMGGRAFGEMECNLDRGL